MRLQTATLPSWITHQDVPSSRKKACDQRGKEAGEGAWYGVAIKSCQKEGLQLGPAFFYLPGSKPVLIKGAGGGRGGKREFGVCFLQNKKERERKK